MLPVESGEIICFGVNGLFSNIKGDAFGGITAGIVALPLALAFGVSSGLGPQAGLYGAIFISFFAALFGGTPTQISGPTAPMTAVSMIVIAGIIAANDGSVEKALPAQIAQTITNLEQMLNFWQDKVESDEKQRKAYAFPDMVKHLMIEY